MATRAMIGRQTGETTWVGVYHHWDGYPEGLGAALFEAHRDHFRGDLAAMLRYLIDEHPAGWSSILGADFTQPPGYGGPACYCHGQRAEPAQTLTQADAQACGCEYAYTFDETAREMYVWASYTPHGQKMIGMFGFGDDNAHWQLWARVPLDGPEPDWGALGEATEPAAV